ncbi:MAG: hypothetical protein EOO61_09090 [Hymenobacter sp.]|nr:MAG: hypothetical protein EOO61_09090 [Hymenobacter sp.]
MGSGSAMLMDSFEVENFRSLKHLKLENLARVNLLVGKNNSGKTTALESMYALANIETSHWLYGIESDRGLDDDEIDFRYLFYSFDDTLPIMLKAVYKSVRSNNLAQLRVQMKLENTGLDFNSEHSKYTRRLSKKRRPTVTNGLAVQVWTSEKAKPLRFEVRHRDYVTSLITSSAIAEKFTESGWGSVASSRNVSELLPTKVGFNQLNEDLGSLLIEKQLDRLVSIIQRIDPRIKSIALLGESSVYLDLGKAFQSLSPLKLMGEGLQKLLSITAAIASTSGGIVFIDEIDNGLHYSALRILWKGVLQAAREYDVQIVTTTHSAEALRHLTWVLDEEEGKEYRDDVAAYTLIRAKPARKKHKALSSAG